MAVNGESWVEVRTSTNGHIRVLFSKTEIRVEGTTMGDEECE